MKKNVRRKGTSLSSLCQEILEEAAPRPNKNTKMQRKRRTRAWWMSRIGSWHRVMGRTATSQTSFLSLTHNNLSRRWKSKEVNKKKVCWSWIECRVMSLVSICRKSSLVVRTPPSTLSCVTCSMIDALVKYPVLNTSLSSYNCLARYLLKKSSHTPPQPLRKWSIDLVNYLNKHHRFLKWMAH